MKLIDTNALIVVVLGMINPKLVNTHPRTSIYEEQDFLDIINFIGEMENLIVLPNVWTEVDNLIENFKGNYRYKHLTNVVSLIEKTTEKFIPTVQATRSECFSYLGITDSVLFECAKNSDALISSDSKLSDFARAYGIHVFDVVKNRQIRQ